MTNTALSDTALVILTAAAQRPGNIALPLPANLKGGAVKRVVDSMIAKGLIEEVEANIRAGEPIWRDTGDGHGNTLVATDAGLAAIGIEPEAKEPTTEPDPEAIEADAQDRIAENREAIKAHGFKKGSFVSWMQSEPLALKHGTITKIDADGFVQIQVHSPEGPTDQIVGHETRHLEPSDRNEVEGKDENGVPFADPADGAPTEPAGAQEEDAAPKVAKANKVRGTAKRVAKDLDISPKPKREPKPRAEGEEAPAPRDTKQAKTIAMLRSEDGATIEEISEATGWQKHTVRGMFAGALKKRLGLEVTSEKVEGRGRVYRLPAA